MEWKQIKPDFSSSNNSMQNAMSGLSSAGTVFEKMREGILAEEQRAIENARAADAAALAQATLDEEVRANQALEDYRAGQLANEQERLKQQALVDAAQIAQYNAGANKAIYELQQLRNNDAAWKIANDTVNSLDPDFRKLTQLDKNLTVTEDDFAKNKDSLYKDYTDYKSFRDINTEEREKIIGKYKNAGITGDDLTGLGNTTGRVNLLEKLYLRNNGTGSIESRLSLADRAGLATEQKQLETARTVAAEDAKKEKELGTSEGIQKAFNGFGLTGPDLLHATQMTKMIQTAAKNNGITLRNSDAVNKVLMSMQMAKDPTSAIGKAWQWFAGKDSISFKSQEELDNILAEVFGVKTTPDNGLKGGSSGNKPKTEKEKEEEARRYLQHQFDAVTSGETVLTPEQFAQQEQQRLERIEELSTKVDRDAVINNVPSDILKELNIDINNIKNADVKRILQYASKNGIRIKNANKFIVTKAAIK